MTTCNIIVVLLFLLAAGCAAPRERAVAPHDPVAASALLLMAPDTDARVKAAAALGELGADNRAAVVYLFHATKDDDPRVRVAALFALDNIRTTLRQRFPHGPDAQVWPTTQDFVPLLNRLLHDDSEDVRNAAAWCLSNIDAAAKTATTPETPTDPQLAELIESLAAPDAGTRIRAATALGDIGARNKSVVPHLLAAMNDRDWRVCKAAAQALDHIRWQLRNDRPGITEAELWPTAQDFTSALARLLDDPNQEPRYVAIYCLINIGPPARAAAARLAALYPNGTALDRLAVLSALGSIDRESDASLAVFLNAAQDKDVDMRVSAASAMCHIKNDPAGRGVVQALINMLGDETWNVKTQAAYGLYLIGRAAKPAIPALTKLTQDPNETVRVHAAQAIDAIQRAQPAEPTR